MRILRILFLFLSLTPLALAWAEDAPQPTTSTDPAPAASDPAPSSSEATASTASTDSAPAEPSIAGGEVSAPGNVTIDFKDADIQNVLRILSYKSGVNIVAGKDVTGSVTMRLVDVPWEKALDMVLKTYGYAYDRDGNVIRVATLENLRREELSTEVFSLNYSVASEVEKSVKDVLSERGKVRSDSRSNTLIVTDIPTALQNAKTVIERLDLTIPQVLIEAKIIETTLGDSDKIGIKWNVKAAVTGSSRPISAPFPSVTHVGNNLLRSVLPPGRGATSTVSDGATAISSTTNDFPVFGAGVGDAFQATFPVADKTDFKFGSVDFSEFQAILHMIQERNDSKILSEPHITTLNNQEAKILVGEVIAIPTFERNSTTGVMEITGYEDKDLGIKLSVTPQVNSANEIVVSVHPEVTTLLGYDQLTKEITAPHFTTREASTRVRIRSGQTIAIGGLIKEDKSNNVTKVPILGDLPLLSKLFSFKDKTVTKTDLLFFMTVTVLDDKNPPQSHRKL